MYCVGVSGLLEHRTLLGDSHNTEGPHRNDREGESGMLVYHIQVSHRCSNLSDYNLQ